MTSKEPSEDEILGIDLDLSSSKLDLITNSSEVDEDISVIEEDLLLLSPSTGDPSPRASTSGTKSPKSKEKQTVQQAQSFQHPNQNVQKPQRNAQWLSPISDRHPSTSYSLSPQSSVSLSGRSKPKSKTGHFSSTAANIKGHSPSPKVSISVSNTRVVTSTPHPTHNLMDDEDDDDVEILEESSISSPRLKTVLGTHVRSKSSIKSRDDKRYDQGHVSNIDDDDEDEDIVSDDDESEISTSGTDGKICIFYCHGGLFLWNADDVLMLREECRIVGKLTGCLPRAPRQNSCLGIPLQLMPEEANLLEEIDAAIVVEEDPVSKQTFKNREKAFKKVREQNYKIQQDMYKENRKEEIEKRLGTIKEGKKAKKRKLKEVKENTEASPDKGDSDRDKNVLSSKEDQSKDVSPSKEDQNKDVPPSEEDQNKDVSSSKGGEDKDALSSKEGQNKDVSPSKEDEATPREEEDDNAPAKKKAGSPSQEAEDCQADANDADDEDAVEDEDADVDKLTAEDLITSETSIKHSLVQLFTENPWKAPAEQCLKWVYPATERELLRYSVFKDLWGKGFFLTSGAKFGGDFLVYPGDPARYHSHYIAVCRHQRDDLPCLDIVSLGRLASNVRKTALLCSLDKQGKVFYTSLGWTGIS